MNISKLIVLGALESLGKGSGYDIDRFVHDRMIHNWTEIKRASIYNALKGLTKDEAVTLVGVEKAGLHPQKTIYAITPKGQGLFDELQREASLGLFPKFYGFKLALKLNQRLGRKELELLATNAVNRIDQILDHMETYLATVKGQSQRDFDSLFLEHDEALYKQERLWIQGAIERYCQVQGLDSE